MIKVSIDELLGLEKIHQRKEWLAIARRASKINKNGLDKVYPTGEEAKGKDNSERVIQQCMTKPQVNK